MRGGGGQHHTTDSTGEHIGSHLGECLDRHAPHGVASEYNIVDVEPLKHDGEVEPKAINGDRAGPKGRAAVTALVVQHYSVTAGDQPAGDRSPDAHPAGPAVRQHHHRPIACDQHGQICAVIGVKSEQLTLGEGEPF